MKQDFLGFHIFQEPLNRIELAGNRERLKDRLIAYGSVSKPWFLRSPIEETESERMMGEEEGVDDTGDERGTEQVVAPESM